MRIVLTGGGTGGHFYPLIAVAEAVRNETQEQQLIDNPELYLMAPNPYDPEALDRLDISYRHVYAGKQRTYVSWKNLLAYFQVILGVLKSLWTLFAIYPDVVFAKGGYACFPVLVSARILRIPVVLHESDSVPGRTNKWAGSFARRIAVSYPQAVEHFPEDKTAVTGNPVREDIAKPAMSGAREYLEIPEDIPVVFVLGGSQGSQTINSVILSALPDLLKQYCVIHQTGSDNIDSVEQTADILFSELSRDSQELQQRYKVFGHLEEEALQMAAGAADIVISRAGSAIFEIAAWAVPSILVPLDIAHADHQRENAFTYARHGAATVIEEANFSDDILLAEIDKIMSDAETYEAMVQSAADFYRPDSADIIARELIHISKTHT